MDRRAPDDDEAPSTQRESALHGPDRAAAFGVLAPTITLPKGGGAIRGIGEKFAANPVNGTAAMVVPIPTSPGRSGFGPGLALSYDSGAGNGSFGFGWTLSVPSITRRTDLGIPRYEDAVDSDVFLLTGAEDLVPELTAQGERLLDASVPGYSIARYRPRIEQGFHRIERWTRLADGDVHWRTLSPQNVLTVFGKDASSRIADPHDARRVYCWLVSETRDDRGNAVIYDYKPEDSVGVDTTLPHERARGDESSLDRGANRHLKRIRYGNRVPLLEPGPQRPIDLSAEAIAAAGWMFEVVFDFGEHQATAPDPADAGPWLCRNDPFSSFRSGFEVRNYRLCQRVLLFHHFPDEPGVGADCLVRSTSLAYRDDRATPSDREKGNPTGTFLESVTQTGYVRLTGGGYETASMPPVDFTYSRAVIDATVHELDQASLDNLPAGVDQKDDLWVDLKGEGLAGVLAERNGGWYYKPNLGGGHLGPLEPVPRFPATGDIGEARSGLMDLDRDGRLELVQFAARAPGFAEHARGEDWDTFVPFRSWPNIDWLEPNLRAVDLTGDGLADLLLTSDEGLVWYPSLGEAGFDVARPVAVATDEELGPRVVMADGTQTVALADMTGDGLADLVRITNGEIAYWPNLGYGRFGRRVVMTNAPVFDTPDGFDPERVRIGDVDGSGPVDVLYLGRDGVRLWFNEAGNGWAEAVRLPQLPNLASAARVQLVDLQGNGTACLVWSSPLQRDARSPIRYIDLMGGTKPNLLVGLRNNLGSETRIHYSSSTRFYLADRQAGRPWITPLPFPVHVVDEVESIDLTTRRRSVARVRYHHGYYDGAEREFRGFAMVERDDTEAFEDYIAGTVAIDGTQETAPELFQPAITTRSWYHTGAFLGDDRVLHLTPSEYYPGTPRASDPSLPPDMTDAEYREAVRALKGLPLRQETFSFDGSAVADVPYSVTESGYEVRRLQPPDGRSHGVFFAFSRETVTTTLDRDAADPRISQRLVLDAGPYGDVLASASIAYGRSIADGSLPPGVRAEQQRTRIAYEETDYTGDIDVVGPSAARRLRVASESRAFEISGAAPASGLFTIDELSSAIAGATPLAYEAVATGPGVEKRVLSRSRSLFRGNDLVPLGLGQIDSLGLGHESYRLAFTPSIVATEYAGAVTDSDLAAAGYVHFAGDTDWWIPSGTDVFPADPAAHFYLASAIRDALGTVTTTELDPYDLLPVRVVVQQAQWNDVVAENDYRVLAATMVTDPNQNRMAVRYDPLGFVVASATMGKAGGTDGDTLADPTTRLEYQLFNWVDSGTPNAIHLFARERHGAADPHWQESYAYCDGSGSVAMVKVQARPGKALQIGGDGTVTEVDADPRWIANGRVVLSNKGLVVKQYEPWFSPNHDFESEQAASRLGVTPIHYYDAIGRNVRTDFPNGTTSTVDFAAWYQRIHDQNDMVRDTAWYADRGSPDPATEPEPFLDEERRAAWLAAKHADTPALAVFDSLGRSIYTVMDLGGGQRGPARSEIDLNGGRSRLFDQLDRPIAAAFNSPAGAIVWTESAEQGRRWNLVNVLGGLVRTWDDGGRVFGATYDGLHRPVTISVTGPAAAETTSTCIVYGDRHPDAVQRNLRGVAHQLFDGAGSMSVMEIDLDGNPTRIERVLTRDYTSAPDWSAVAAEAGYAAVQATAAGLLETSEPFVAESDHDALGRPTEVRLHGGTVIRPTYDEGNALRRLEARVNGIGPFVEFLADQQTDAKGQRQLLHLGNDVITRCFYDPSTFRLTRLLSASAGAPMTDAIQDLSYTYDPVGNITTCRDAAQQTVFFDNAVVPAVNRFEYDAGYRLIGATGREHASTSNNTIRDQHDLDAVGQIPDPGDVAALRTYSEAYVYDVVGNLLEHRHSAAGGVGSWTRRSHYAHQDDPADTRNRLVSSSRPGDPAAGPYSQTYSYDSRGNFDRLSTPNPGELVWDLMDQLQQVDLGGGGTVYYVYATGGRRVRKVIERIGSLRTERIYLGALEIYRERRGVNPPHLERRTVHISDAVGRLAQVDVKTIDSDGSDPANPLGVPLVRYVYGNHLGSATLETDAIGQVISYEEYHPFGTSAYRSGKSGVDISLKRYRFSGKERDRETGLDYFGLRYYAPWLGRWISPDPAGLASGLNQYRFCSNNPVMRFDPSGAQDSDKCFVMNPTLGVPVEAIGTECHIPGMQYVTAEGTPIGTPDPANGQATGTDKTPTSPSTPPPSTGPPPARAGITAVQEGARPTAAITPDPVARTRVGAPRTFVSGEPLPGPYNLWSNEKGGGLGSAAKAPGFIMEDTAFEEAAEAAAKRLGYTGRYDPKLKYGTPDFAEVWHPTSNGLATRAGVSQMGVESHGIDPASLGRNPGYDPSGSVQVTREIPRVRTGGGAMAGLGLLSGFLTLWGASHVENTGVRYVGYGAGGAEIAGTLRYIQGLLMLGRTPGSAAVMSQGALLGRFAGGVGAIVLSTYALITDLQSGNYGTVLGDGAGIVAGGAVLAGAGVVAAVAGGVAATNMAGDYVERKVTEATGSRTAGVAAGTAAGAALGAGIGAAIGVWGFGVAAIPAAAVGAVIGGICGFIGSFW